MCVSVYSHRFSHYRIMRKRPELETSVLLEVMDTKSVWRNPYIWPNGKERPRKGEKPEAFISCLTGSQWRSQVQLTDIQLNCIKKMQGRPTACSDLPGVSERQGEHKLSWIDCIAPLQWTFITFISLLCSFDQKSRNNCDINILLQF